MTNGEQGGIRKHKWQELWDGWQAVLRRNHVLGRARRGDFDPLLADAEAALNSAVWGFGSDHPETGRKLAALAAVHAMRGESNPATALYRRAIGILSLVHKSDRAELTALREQFAAFLHGIGDFVGAEKEYEALVSSEQTRHSNRPRAVTARLMDALAQTRSAQGNSAGAKAGHRDALLCWEAVCGPGSPEVARCLTHLASLYLSERRYDEAEPLLLRAVAEWKSSPNPHDLYAVITLSCCGDLYRSTGRGNEARGVEATAKAMLSRYAK